MNILNEIETAIPALRRYARALVGDIHRADDLVQDCLERAVRKKHLWKPKGSVRAWLFTILLNIHRDSHRTNRTHLIPLTEEHHIIGTLGDQEDRLALNQTIRHIARLPLEQKQVLLLIALEGFNYSEAASILAIPKGTLMSRLARARTNLREMRDQPQSPKLRSMK